MTIGQTLAKTAAKALELMAENEFSRAKILEACNAAAAKGFMTCQMRPSVPVDLSKTKCLQALRAELEKERVDSSWIPHAMPGEPAFKVLELRWETRSTAT